MEDLNHVIFNFDDSSKLKYHLLSNRMAEKGDRYRFNSGLSGHLRERALKVA
ncbi:unnamed protein product [Brugia timori]|uniref:Transposase n=1 Tax=Brugia timori TaxID=42155 RepID=A0A0R3R0M5_9BILA|nr:unnamed protein product [Brugia timori]